MSATEGHCRKVLLQTADLLNLCKLYATMDIFCVELTLSKEVAALKTVELFIVDQHR